MSTCEWNRVEQRPTRGDDAHQSEATIMVGAQGQWHLCDSCAALPEFKRYRVRKLLRRSQAASPRGGGA